METFKIRALIKAIEKKSLSKASLELSYTPSALSHIADSIEQEFGLKIIKRTAFGVELTENGKLVYDKLINLINVEDDMLDLIRELISKEQNTLRIGTYSSIAQHLLPDILSEFSKQHPNINVSVRVGDKIRDWIKEDLCDVSFFDGENTNQTPHIKLLNDPYVVIAPSTMFKGKKIINAQELYEHTFICTNEQCLRSYFELKRFKNIINIDSVDDSAVIAMVKNGLGVSVQPELMVKKQLKGVKVLKLSPSLERNIIFTHKKNVTAQSATGLFVEFIKNYKMQTV